MTSSHVASLLEACPFLRQHLDSEYLDLGTVIFGATAAVLIERRLPVEEENRVFDYFNRLASEGNSEALEILGTGAIELFNDSDHAQRLAREKLTGSALRMLEDFRLYWGQPDFGRAK